MLKIQEIRQQCGDAPEIAAMTDEELDFFQPFVIESPVWFWKQK